VTALVMVVTLNCYNQFTPKTYCISTENEKLTTSHYFNTRMFCAGVIYTVAQKNQADGHYESKR